MKYFKEIILFFLLGLLIVGVFVHFDKYFNYTPQDTTLDGWVNTAIYFNNVFSPIFLLLSVVLIYLTWSETRETLKNMRKREEIELISRVSSELEKRLEEQSSLTSLLSGDFFFSINYRLLDYVREDEHKEKKLIDYFSKFEIGGVKANVKSKEDCVNLLTEYFQTKDSKRNLLLKSTRFLNRYDENPIDFIFKQIDIGADFPKRDLDLFVAHEFQKEYSNNGDLNLFIKLIERLMNVDDKLLRKKLLDELSFYFSEEVLNKLLALDNNLSTAVYKKLYER